MVDFCDQVLCHALSMVCDILYLFQNIFVQNINLYKYLSFIPLEIRLNLSFIIKSYKMQKKNKFNVKDK